MTEKGKNEDKVKYDCHFSKCQQLVLLCAAVSPHTSHGESGNNKRLSTWNAQLIRYIDTHICSPCTSIIFSLTLEPYSTFTLGGNNSFQCFFPTLGWGKEKSI